MNEWNGLFNFIVVNWPAEAGVLTIGGLLYGFITRLSNPNFAPTQKYVVPSSTANNVVTQEPPKGTLH